jgi:hypothetical protein
MTDTEEQVYPIASLDRQGHDDFIGDDKELKEIKMLLSNIDISCKINKSGLPVKPVKSNSSENINPSMEILNILGKNKNKYSSSMTVTKYMNAHDNKTTHTTPIHKPSKYFKLKSSNNLHVKIDPNPEYEINQRPERLCNPIYKFLDKVENTGTPKTT